MRTHPTSAVAAAAAVAAALLVGGCSSSSTPAPAPTAARPSGPCDAGALATHAGVAAGAEATYVWKPYRAGRFAKTAKGRTAALKTASAAAGRVAKELTAVTAVGGCATSVSVRNALGTSVSLARSVKAQLAAGRVDAAALGGLNSSLTTVVQQTREAGAKVHVTVPAPADLAG